MKKLLLSLMLLASAVAVNAKSNILIAYFSWGGNTKALAEEIQRQTGADIFRIEPVTSYSTNYSTVAYPPHVGRLLVAGRVCRNEPAVGNNQLPRRPHQATRIRTKRLLHLGGKRHLRLRLPRDAEPNRGHGAEQLLHAYDLGGKHVFVATTHAGSGAGSNRSAIQQLEPDAIVSSNVLAVRASSVGASTSAMVDNWLEAIGF